MLIGGAEYCVNISDTNGGKARCSLGCRHLNCLNVNGSINAHQQQRIAVSCFKTLQNVYLSRADRRLGRIAFPFVGELAMRTIFVVQNHDTFN